MEMNVEKTAVIRMSGRPPTMRIMVDQKQLEDVEYFNCLGSFITNDARCTCEIKSGIVMAEVAFNRKKTLYSSKLDLKFKE
jgi:hypothetical protein